MKFLYRFVLANETGNEIIILGDMNLDLLPNKKNGLVKKLTNLHRVSQFKQLVTKPTRITEHSRTLIDHITTNRDNFITYTDVQSSGLSGHMMVYTVRKATQPRYKPKQIKARTYRRFDPDAFIHDVSIAPWTNVYEQLDVDSSWITWKVIFLRTCDKHAPRNGNELTYDVSSLVNSINKPGLKIVCLNVRGLVGKIDKIRDLLM